MISAHTRLLALIGDPVSHSITPRAQNAAWRHSGADVRNLAFRVAPHRLSDAVRGAQSLGLLGLMVTIPHKEAILPLCDELDASARALGAGNLLEFRRDGRIVGHSSDGWGALRSLAEKGFRVEGTRVLLLGAGGSARSLALTLADAGVRHLSIHNRTLERAQALCDEVSAREVEASPGGTGTDELEDAASRADLIINASSLGMTPGIDVTPLPEACIQARHTVFDIVYNPLETRLLREARQRGARVIDGLDMVLYTSVYAARVCAGVELSIEVMRAAALEVLAERSP